MRKVRSRKLAILLVLAFMATMFAGIGTASAATTNTVVGALPSIADTGNYTLASLRIDEEVLGNFAVGDVITVTLPSGVEYRGVPTAAVTQKPNSGTWGGSLTCTPAAVSARVYNFTIGGALDTAPSVITLTIPVTVTSKGDGDIAVNVAAPGTAITQGDFVLGKFVTGSATASVLATPSRGGSGTYGTIRIVENSIGALGNSETIVCKLPAGWTWGAAQISPSNDASINAAAAGLPFTLTAAEGMGTRTATFTITAAGTRVGIYDITTPIIAGSSATKGEVTVSFSGTGDVTGDVVIGKYADYDATVSVAEAKNVTSAKDNQRIANVTVKEDIPGSLIPGRTVTFLLPENTRFNTAPTLTLVSGNNIWATAVLTLSDNDKKATATLTTTASTTAAELRLGNVDIDVAANVSGDIEMVVGGTAGASGTVVVAKADPIVTLSSEPKEVKIGIQSQEAGDIIITEGAKEAILAGTSEQINLVAPSGVTFAAVPTVEVIEGNFEYDTVSRVTTNASNDTIRIIAKTQSTKPSTIKVSGIKITADRNVPEGPIKVSIAGNAIMQNATAFTNVTNAGATVIANCVTPAPGETKVTSVFTVGETKYTVGGVEVTMNVAPYIDANTNSTLMPLRAAANAVGVDNDNIFWDDSTKTVTILKGDRVVTMTIGKVAMTINGASIAMPQAPVIKAGSTMLPIRALSTALNADITWDQATQTITVTPK